MDTEHEEITDSERVKRLLTFGVKYELDGKTEFPLAYAELVKAIGLWDDDIMSVSVN